MLKYKMLILTDHTGHSKENSLYKLASAAAAHPLCLQTDVATRGNPLNDLFFREQVIKTVFATKVDDGFSFHEDGHSFKRNLRRVSLRDYDAIWLRLPPPLSLRFLEFLDREFPSQLIVNDPMGIHKTGSKAFLMNFQQFCPPMQICQSIDDIIHFKNEFPIVLKPFRDYGGKGIIRIEGNEVWEGKEKSTFAAFIAKLRGSAVEYLGVKFLKNVDQGDKRIVVVDGRIMGASLRLPAKGSWICNVAMGGSSNHAEVEEEEIAMIQGINPLLSDLGIVMYGVDTLVGDNGRRVLSEINTTSIGGIAQISALKKEPTVQKTVHLIWQYIKTKISEEDVIGN